MLILAGDIGGTTTRLAFFEAGSAGLETVARELSPVARRQPGGDRAGFSAAQGLVADRACFGIAGPVHEGRVQTPTSPGWSTAGNWPALGLARVS